MIKNKIIKIGHAVKKCDRDRAFFVIQFVFLILICILHSMQAGHYVDFFPTNGTFQNFNPIRRMIAGQIPYKDFQDYLGLGHLYWGTVFTVLFGKNYRASLVAFSFLTFFGLSLIFMVLGKAISGSRKVALTITNILLVLLIVQPLFFSNMLVGITDIQDALTYALGTGNSARFIRGMALPISCILIWAGYNIVDYIGKKRQKINKYKELIYICIAAAVSGIAFVWSNDYGISSWLCIFVMTFIIVFSKTKKFTSAVMAALLELVLSFIAVIIFAEIFTMGHFPEWFKSTFSTGGYQNWYYNSRSVYYATSKSFYIFDLDISFLTLLQACISVVYIIRLFLSPANKKELIRYGIPAFFNMVSFCAVNEYRLLSGGESREVALAVLFTTIIFELGHLVYSYLTSKEKVRLIFCIISVVLSFSWIMSDARDEVVFWKATPKEGKYIEALGGNIRQLGNELLSANKFLKGNKFFSTYASGQEVVNNIFQPSGTDYIIHVLGDQQREDYMKCFRKADFKYTATIKGTYTSWEYWVERANWFFYRELYQKWHPVYSNTYEMYWEKNQEDNILSNAVTSVQIKDIDKATKKIIVKADKNVNGMADVYIDYSVEKQNNTLAKLQWQRMLKVENTGTLYSDQGVEPEANYFESNYLREKSKEYVPVTLVDGYGEIKLTASPSSSCYLKLNNVSCKTIYPVTFEYIEVKSLQDKKKVSVLNIDNDAKNRQILKNAIGLLINGQEYEIKKVKKDDKIISVSINTDGRKLNKGGQLLKNNNIFKVVK